MIPKSLRAGRLNQRPNDQLSVQRGEERERGHRVSLLLDTHRVYWCMQNAPAREESGMMSSLYGHRSEGNNVGRTQVERGRWSA